ncbi:hypothetical protein BC941DRAFT_359363 [Chlamydoabsidia padenii]|nr:hypothetical protein BC941DRAFT_359363 [Chlamydoabsidia padenii]
MRPPGTLPAETVGPNGLPLKFTPLQQQQQQQQLSLQQQQLQLQQRQQQQQQQLQMQQQQQHPTPPPPLPENLAQYQQRDRDYQDILNQQHKRHLHLAQEKKREIEIGQHERKIRLHGPQGVVATFGPGYRGLGNGTTGMQSKLIYPRDKKHMKEQSSKDDNLVPIRLEFETDGYKLRDTFTWNLNEQLVTPEQFAEHMCEDLRLPPAAFIPQIARSIRDQVQDYYLHASSMKFKQNAELRMLIKLDITVGHKALLDQFEWDINCTENSPEQFAEVLCSDLGLGGEFRTAIAHSIREQVHVYTKSLLLVGHEFDGPVVDDDLKHSFLPFLKTVTRDADTVERFTPALMELSDAELQKNEKDRLREARRKRRQTRGRRGIILPDREPLKTNRTTHETQPEQEMTDDQFFAGMSAGGGLVNGMRGSTPIQEAMHSQRRSALRARANIAAEAAGHLPGNQTPPQSSPSFINTTY